MKQLRPVLFLCLAALAGAAVAEPPLWATSAQAPQLAEKVLAQTPMGPVTALDVLMFDALNDQALQTLPADTLLKLDTVTGEAAVPGVNALIDKMVVLWVIGRGAGEWTPPADYQRVSGFVGAHAVWNEKFIVPEVKVLDIDVERHYLAHAERFYNRRRAQARYIFMPTPASGRGIEAVNRNMETVRRHIASGGITFEDAARQYLKAASAGEGGLLPPFENGDYFPEFERQVYALDKPGDLSEVFYGPRGMYLAELVSKDAPRNVPLEEAAPEIRAALLHDHARQYHLYELGRLREDLHAENRSAWWSYMDSAAPVALVGTTALPRDGFFNYYPDPTGVDYKVDVGLVWARIADWIDGEAVMERVEAMGAAGDPWIARARELGAITPRARRAIAAQIPASDYAYATLATANFAKRPAALDRLRQARLIEFELGTRGTERILPSEQRAAERLVAQNAASLGRGILRAEPRPINLTQWYANLQADDSASVKAAIEKLKEDVKPLQNDQFFINIKDYGWVDTLPGTGWDRLLARRGPGQVSEERVVGEEGPDRRHYRYLILDDKPADLALLAGQPLVAQIVLYAARQEEIYTNAATALAAGEGAIKHVY